VITIFKVEEKGIQQEDKKTAIVRVEERESERRLIRWNVSRRKNEARPGKGRGREYPSDIDERIGPVSTTHPPREKRGEGVQTPVQALQHQRDRSGGRERQLLSELGGHQSARKPSHWEGKVERGDQTIQDREGKGLCPKRGQEKGNLRAKREGGVK